jgi:hypothetical protein
LPRIFNIKDYQLQTWLEKARAESDTIVIDQPIPNIDPVREMVSAFNNDEPLLLLPLMMFLLKYRIIY